MNGTGATFTLNGFTYSSIHLHVSQHHPVKHLLHTTGYEVLTAYRSNFGKLLQESCVKALRDTKE